MLYVTSDAPGSSPQSAATRGSTGAPISARRHWSATPAARSTSPTACRRHDFGYRNLQLLDRRYGSRSLELPPLAARRPAVPRRHAAPLLVAALVRRADLLRLGRDLLRRRAGGRRAVARTQLNHGHIAGGSGPSMPRATRSNWCSTRAVAPQIVSSSSSKKNIGRAIAVEVPDLLAERVGAGELGERHPQDALDFVGRRMQRPADGRAIPTTGTMKLPRHHRRDRVEATVRAATAEGSSATSSCASRSAACLEGLAGIDPATREADLAAVARQRFRPAGQQHLGAIGPVARARPAPPTHAGCRWERVGSEMPAAGDGSDHVGGRQRADTLHPRSTLHRGANPPAAGSAGRRRTPCDALRATQRGSSHFRPAGRARLPCPAVFRLASTLPGGCSPRSHSSQAVCSLWRSGGGGRTTCRSGYRSSPRWRRTALTPLPTRRPAMRPTSVLRPPSAETACGLGAHREARCSTTRRGAPRRCRRRGTACPTRGRSTAAPPATTSSAITAMSITRCTRRSEHPKCPQRTDCDRRVEHDDATDDARHQRVSGSATRQRPWRRRGCTRPADASRTDALPCQPIASEPTARTAGPKKSNGLGGDCSQHRGRLVGVSVCNASAPHIIPIPGIPPPIPPPPAGIADFFSGLSEIEAFGGQHQSRRSTLRSATQRG